LDNGKPTANSPTDGEITVDHDEFDLIDDTVFLDNVVLQRPGPNQKRCVRPSNDHSDSATYVSDGAEGEGVDEGYDAPNAGNDYDDWSDGRPSLHGSVSHPGSVLDRDDQVQDAGSGASSSINSTKLQLESKIAQLDGIRFTRRFEQQARVRKQLLDENPEFRGPPNLLTTEQTLRRLQRELELWDAEDRRDAERTYPVRHDCIRKPDVAPILRKEGSGSPKTPEQLPKACNGASTAKPEKVEAQDSGVKPRKTYPVSGSQLINSDGNSRAKCELEQPGNPRSNDLHGTRKSPSDETRNGSKTDNLPGTTNRTTTGCCDRCGWCWGEEKFGPNVHHRTFVSVEADCRDTRKQHRIAIHRFRFRIDNRLQDHDETNQYIHDRSPYWLRDEFYWNMNQEAQRQLGMIFPFDVLTKLGVDWHTVTVSYEYQTPGWGNEMVTKTILPHQTGGLDFNSAGLNLTQPMHEACHKDQRGERDVVYDSHFHLKLKCYYDYKPVLKRLVKFQDNLFARRMKQVLLETKGMSDMGCLARIMYALDDYQTEHGDEPDVILANNEPFKDDKMLFAGIKVDADAEPQVAVKAAQKKDSKKPTTKSAQNPPQNQEVKPKTAAPASPSKVKVPEADKKDALPKKKKQEAEQKPGPKAQQTKDDDSTPAKGKKPKIAPPEPKIRREKSQAEIEKPRRMVHHRLGPRYEDERPRYLYEPPPYGAPRYSRYHSRDWRP